LGKLIDMGLNTVITGFALYLILKATGRGSRSVD
jgi:hypothetical protein